jgi:hypothetical protein
MESTSPWVGRSGLSLRLAAFGTVTFGVLVLLFNARYEFREPLIQFGFPLNALVFHVGLGIAIWSLSGDPQKRGKHPILALMANLIPVVLFWVMVYGVIQAIRNFT